MRAVKWLSRERCLSHLVPVVAGEEPLPPQQKKKKKRRNRKWTYR